MVRPFPFVRGVGFAAAQCNPLRAIAAVTGVVALISFTAGVWITAPIRAATLCDLSDSAFQPCSRADLLAAARGKTLPRDHLKELRPLAVFAANAPPFLRLEPDTWGRRGVSILSVGCSDTWALLELAGLFPRATTACIDFSGYQGPQPALAADFALVALAHNVSVPCQRTLGGTTRTPQFPTVTIMREGVTREPITPSVTPDGGGSVDLIVSMHALSVEESLSADSPDAFLPRLLRLLRPGGAASLMLSTLQQLPLEEVLGSFDVFRVAHTSALAGPPEGAALLSVLLYGRRGIAGEGPHVGIYARRCALDEAPSPGDPAGCLFAPPTTTERVLTPAAVLRAAAEARVALLSPAVQDTAARAYRATIESAGAGAYAAAERYQQTQKLLASLWAWFDSLPPAPE